MTEIRKISAHAEAAEELTADQLFPLIYDELRKLAASKLRQEYTGQTLQATSLVHEAFLRLIDVNQPQQWQSRGHLFAAAAEAMRRILVDVARRKQRVKHGGEFRRSELTADQAVGDGIQLEILSLDDDLLALDEALKQLAVEDQTAARLVELRHFGGMSNADAAEVLEISPRTADRRWEYARAWLGRYLAETSDS